MAELITLVQRDAGFAQLELGYGGEPQAAKL